MFWLPQCIGHLQAASLMFSLLLKPLYQSFTCFACHFFMGDVNINMLSDDVSTMQFETVLSTYCCVNTVDLPSRITDHSATLLDVCITNVPMNKSFTGLFSRDLSDHLPIFALFSTATNKPTYNEKTTYRVINQPTLEKFHSEIAHTDWSFVYAEQNSDRAYSAFSRYLKACYDNSFPVMIHTKKKKKFRKPWINKSLHKRIKTKKQTVS